MKGEVQQLNGKRVATPEYRSWQAMKNRCLNPKADDYRYYGARGITIARRWHAYDAFLADMGRRPSPKHTLDRKKVNKNYCKSNCRWATRAQQSRNRTDTRFSEKAAATIRKLYATGRFRQIDIAKRYGSTQAAISQITRIAAWQKLEVARCGS